MTSPARQGSIASRWVPGRLYRAGAICLLLAAALIALRLVLSHAWRPQDFDSALSFIVAELLLLPAAIMLLAVGAAWDMGRRGTWLGRVALALEQRHGSWLPRLLVVIALVCAGVSSYLSVPAVARHWGWGRFGLGPPVPLRTLDEVIDITCLAFPKGSVLLYGDYDHLFEQHLRATVAIPLNKVDEFLQQPILSRGSSSDTERYVKDEPWAELDRSRWPPGTWKPDSAQRFLSGRLDYHGYLAVWSWLISLDDPGRALFYLVYWDKGPGNAQAAVAELRKEAARDAQPNTGLRKALPGADVETPE